MRHVPFIFNQLAALALILVFPGLTQSLSLASYTHQNAEWASGHSLAIMTTGKGERNAESFDGEEGVAVCALHPRVPFVRGFKRHTKRHEILAS